MRAAALAECSDQSKAATHCRIVTLTLGRRLSCSPARRVPCVLRGCSSFGFKCSSVREVWRILWIKELTQQLDIWSQQFSEVTEELEQLEAGQRRRRPPTAAATAAATATASPQVPPVQVLARAA
jgi:hypothetical protein